jgi:hypothetical protein
MLFKISSQLADGEVRKPVASLYPSAEMRAFSYIDFGLIQALPFLSNVRNIQRPNRSLKNFLL